jgi:hypothetical protein
VKRHPTPYDDLPLFDAASSEAARDDALALVTGSETRLLWIEDYSEFARGLLPGWTGTFEDLRCRFLQSGGAEPEHFNLWGAAAREIVRQGILVRTGRHEKAKFVQNHARELPEYRRRDDDAPAIFFCRGVDR